MLRARVDMLNKLAGAPLTPWIRTADGRNVAQVGNFHLSGAYGGVSLHCMHNEAGGLRDVFGCGHITRRELFDRLCAYMQGFEDARRV